MRFLSYIWAEISPDSPWAMGLGRLQLLAWLIGLIIPIILLIGIYFKYFKVVFVLSLIIFLASSSLLAMWLWELDHWMDAHPPLNCNREACDNDGKIRVIFSAGTVLLPVLLPSLVCGLITLYITSRLIFDKTNRNT